ncbi:hypothetical protein BDV95DRAFT_646969 [Massariosphaeria phaeospora]|uniref:Uncharacterized protein n=1 Tax=Massariosphaeria phaeospora TaxID=100035 RepID=A0A7C8I8W5_9PLEO|nr:hypothetical protein BDV95DRAFT_646969 [Massariosphaeria phaeospora]
MTSSTRSPELTIASASRDAAVLAHRDASLLFHMLPLELREWIYDYILDPEPAAIDPGRHIRQADGTLHSLFHVNRATFCDAGFYFLRTRVFQIDLVWSPGKAYYEFLQFLESFPEESGFVSVRRLNFRAKRCVWGSERAEMELSSCAMKDGRLCEYGELNRYKQLLRDCIGLREVEFAMPSECLVEIACLVENMGELRAAIVQELLRRYNLDLLLQCNSVTRVELYLMDTFHGFTGDGPIPSGPFSKFFEADQDL